MPLRFYKRPILVPVFTNKKKQSEEDFTFKKKGGKQKERLVFVLQQTILEAARSPRPCFCDTVALFRFYVLFSTIW